MVALFTRLHTASGRYSAPDPYGRNERANDCRDAFPFLRLQKLKVYCKCYMQIHILKLVCYLQKKV